jgi:hypothetical protein
MLRFTTGNNKVAWFLGGLRGSAVRVALFAGCAVLVAALAAGRLLAAETSKEAESQRTPAGQQAKPKTKASTREQRQEPYRIQPLDVLTIRVTGTLIDQPIDGKYLVEPDGKVPLGPTYGRVDVKGLDIEQAEKKVAEHLKEILKNPEVQIAHITKGPVRQLENERQSMRVQQQYLRSTILDKCGLSPENVTPILLGLERDTFAAQTEIHLKHVRGDKLAEVVAEATKEMAKRTAADSVAEHLKTIVEAKQAILSNIEKRNKATPHTVSDTEVKKAEVDLAEAQVRLALRKEELAKSAAGAEIERLNQQLRELSVDLQQDEIRDRLLGVRLAGLRQVRGIVDEYTDITEYELPRVNRALEKARAAYEGLPASVP